MKHISKAERKQLLETRLQKEASISKALQFSRKRFKRFDEVIIRASQGEDLSAYHADNRVFKLFQVFCNKKGLANRVRNSDLKEIYLQLFGCSLLTKGPEYIQAVCNMAIFKNYWRNDLKAWKPVAKTGSAQVKELAEFLFCKYATPAFLHKAFYEEKDLSCINWYIHLGQGGSMKDITGFPVPFTHKMNHWFLQAPGKFSVQEAIRWAQVKGMGGDDKIADRFAYSWLALKPAGDEAFWTAFIQLVLNGGMFNPDKLTELIDYVREQRRFTADYELKGRTLTSLLRQSDEWHSRFSFSTSSLKWKPCGIESLTVKRKNDTVVIDELNSGNELAEEGRNMRHCVASYAYFCKQGRTAIYSLRIYAEGLLQKRLATIEVNLQAKKIVQAKGKLNAKISGEARGFMDKWAEQEGLSISPYL